jgi:hypothetical protein
MRKNRSWIRWTFTANRIFTEAAELSIAQIRERIRAAAQELESVDAAVDPADIRRRPAQGKVSSRWHRLHYLPFRAATSGSRSAQFLICEVFYES